MQILIAEDENVSRLFLRKHLQKLGYDVTTTRDGLEAYEKYQTDTYPIVITDWMMPKMDGLELVKKLRSNADANYSYIIMLTAKSDKNDFIACMEAGVDDFVIKPFDPEELRARLIAAERVLALKQRLSQQNMELNEANIRMKHDLQAAAQIQESLLPNEPPPLKDVNVDWKFTPCEELAGDTLNVFNIDENHLGLYLLDVSGHGVTAALLAVTLSRMLSPVIDEGSIVKRRINEPPYYRIFSPAEVATRLNKRFQINPENGQYFTLVYGILNRKTREFKYVSAGQPDIIHLSTKTQSSIVSSPDLPIGFLEDVQYENQVMYLDPGDRIVIYSDGIPEAQNAQGEQYGTERMLTCLDNNIGNNLKTSLEALVDEAYAWCAPDTIKDDVSVLAMELVPVEASVPKLQKAVDLAIQD